MLLEHSISVRTVEDLDLVPFSLLGFSNFVSFSYSLRIVFRRSRLTVRFVETTSQPTFKKKVSNHSH